MPAKGYYAITVNQATRRRLAALSVALGASRSSLTVRALEAFEDGLPPDERARVAEAKRLLSQRSGPPVASP